MKKILWTRNLIVSIVLIIKFITKGATQSYTPKVQIDSGLVVGEFLTTVIKSLPYAAFRGIPYAEPPIKNLRFKPPIPKRPWNGVWQATSDPERCMQIERKTVVGSEDCLYLNVYTPTEISQNLRPVIVWIHGGAFTTGNGNSSYYGPDFLLEEDLIVVSVQYRLGPFGFLNINHPAASGNYGLKDQNLALQWVQRNIRNFGGDPGRVTLFGQSAGGVAVDLHKLSDMSAGLFSQTISMSSSPLCKYWAFQSNVEAYSQAFSLGVKLGLKSNKPKDLLKLLYNAPANLIIQKANELPMVPFRPTLEKADIAPNRTKFLTECTPKKYKEGRYNKGPHLMGFTSSEILTLAKTFNDLIGFHSDASRYLKEKTVLGAIPFVPQFLSRKLNRTAELKRSVLSLVVEELSDIYFVTGIDKKQQLLDMHNNYPIYYYRFVFKSPYSAHKIDGIEYLDGTGHEDELPYIFYRPFINLPLSEPGIAATRERLVRMWANFAKYGNPTPDGNADSLLGVTWPNSGSDGKHLEIGNSLIVKERPTNILIKFYQLIGLGDSSIYNECEKNVASNIINGIVNIPGAVKNIADNPSEIFNILSNTFG